MHEQSIVSRITFNIGTLKTLSNDQLINQPEFTLFTHLKKRSDGIPLIKSYKELREAILELFLSVKIRSDEEIEAYNNEMFQLEKMELCKNDGFEIVDMLKECIESLMKMRELNEAESSISYTDNSMRETSTKNVC